MDHKSIQKSNKYSSSTKRGTTSSLVANELFLDTGKDDSFNLCRSDSYDRSKTQDLTVICLPSYIIHSHKLTKNCSNDISKEYNIQLRNADNENLYVSCHQELLQIMSQYVYYRKLCIWIKEELQKKRMELLEVARKALLDARREQECLYIGESTPKSSIAKAPDWYEPTYNKHVKKFHTNSDNSECSRKCVSGSSQDSFNEDDFKKSERTQRSNKPRSKSSRRTPVGRPYTKPRPKKQKPNEKARRNKNSSRNSNDSCDNNKTEKKCVIL